MKKILNINSKDLIDALCWSERYDKELEQELILGNYPKDLIKKAFDENDKKALDKLIKIAEERIKNGEKK